MTELVCIVLLVPLAWSALAAGVRRLAGNPAPNDLTEKYQLLIMVTPVLLGAIWIGLAPFLPISLSLPLPPLDDGGTATPMAHTATALIPARPTAAVKPWLTGTLLAVWGLGALLRAAPLVFSLMRLGRIAARAERREIDGAAVCFTGASLPPLAWGRATILLPSGLMAQMAPDELRLIIRHEQAHLRRRDPLYFTVLGLLDALLWFNPFLRAQTRRCRLAAELACDAAASGKSAIEREAYARVLIRTLKHTAGNVRSHAPAAISNVKSGDYRMRLSEIMHADSIARKPKRRWGFVALAAALVPVAFVQFAWAQGGIPASVPIQSQVQAQAPAEPDAPKPQAAPAVMAPVDAPISVAFGRRVNRETGKIDFHQGVDFAVPVGTPVRAYADGEVTAVTTRWGYGKLVEIDHGDGLETFYAHLDSQAVAVGDHVKVGQVIATTGDTGKVDTGPHLHFETRMNGTPVDPATRLPKAG